MLKLNSGRKINMNDKQFEVTALTLFLSAYLFYPLGLAYIEHKYIGQKAKDALISLIFVLIVLVITACGKDGNLFKKQEYLIDGEWLHCSVASINQDCGVTLNCSGQVYQCTTNLQSRSR